jgi:hypothetical protein
VIQERLLHDRRGELAMCFAHAGADPDWWSDRLEQRWHVNPEDSGVATVLRRRFDESVGDDVAALRDLLGDDLPEWD